MPDSAFASEADIPEGEQAALELLERGTLEVEGRLVDASNATLFCAIKGSGAEAFCVYKPVAGERPLWDFPTGTLAGREVSAYLVSRAAGWDIVPPTVMRDGPFGPGMCQLWIDIDDDEDLVALSRREDHAGLRDMAVFDAVINNADRKIGHLLPVTAGHLYGCDHGVTFSEDYKLRTVLWQWRGKALPPRSVDALRRLADGLGPDRVATLGGAGLGSTGLGGAGLGGTAFGGTGLGSIGWLSAELSKHLTRAEVDATRIRVAKLLAHRVHPFPPDDWPAIPWPPV
jgi:uncharacterized repeat protein (TIGR03843 family)